MIGTTAALLLAGTAIKAGADVYGAHKAASGATKAAETQAKAANQAMDRLGPIMAPYVNTGAQAMTTLGGLMGLGAGGPMGGGGAAGGTTGPAHLDPTGRMVPANSPIVGTAVPRAGAANPYGDLPANPQFVQQEAMARNASSYGAPAGATDQMVMVKAPTGELRRMPKAQADQFVQHGATIVQG